MANPQSAARRKPRFRERNTLKQAPTKSRLSTPPPPPPAQVRRRPQAGALQLALPQVRVEHVLYASLLLIGFALRFADVGSRAMHGDEAEHAWFAWHLYNGTGYQYDPVYHGPLQFIVTAFFYFLFGVSETSARLMAVLFGTALIVLPYFFRNHMGRVAALLASAYITFSPAFLYVSRLERDDIFTCFFAFTLAIAIFSYLRARKARYVYLGAASVALSLASMENTYITLFVFGSFLVVAVGSEMLSSRRLGAKLVDFWWRTGSEHRIEYSLLLGTGALLLAAFVLTVWKGFAIPVPLVLGVAIVLLVHRQVIMRSTPDGELRFSEGLRSISRQQWLNAVTILIAILFLTYSTFGTNLRGIWDASQPLLNSAQGCQGNHFPLNPCRKDIIGGLFYWLSQHGVHRGGQPWFYYTFLFGLYEQIALVLGVGGILWFLRRPTLFTSFLTYWAVLMFGIYSWAGEKFPWLMIHPLLPFTLLAAMFVAELLRLARPIKWGALALVGLLALLEIHSAYEVNYVNGADPVEMMVYVQSAPDTPTVARDILVRSNKATNGNDLHVTIDSLDTWPFAWYLRDMPNVAYVQSPDLTKKPYSSNPVIIVDAADQPALAPQLRNYTGHRYRLRWWFPEDYKTLSWQSFFQDLKSPSYWGVVSDWLINRRPFGPRQGLFFYYYVKNGLVSPY